MSLASILFSSLSRLQPSDPISSVTLQVYPIVPYDYYSIGQILVANKKQSFLDERSRWMKILLWCPFLYCLVLSCLVLSCPVLSLTILTLFCMPYWPSSQARLHGFCWGSYIEVIISTVTFFVVHTLLLNKFTEGPVS